MGALKGNAGYLRFLVKTEGPPSSYDDMEGAIETRRFLKLSPDGESMESAGWTFVDDPMNDDEPLTRDRFMFGELLSLAYREDKYTVPRPVLQQRVKERLEKILAEEGEDAAKKVKTRAFKKAVEAAVLVEMKRQAFAKTKLVDIVWDMKKGEVRVFGRGSIAKEHVVSLFERTFGVGMTMAVFPARTTKLALTEREQKILEDLKPDFFASEETVTV